MFCARGRCKNTSPRGSKHAQKKLSKWSRHCTKWLPERARVDTTSVIQPVNRILFDDGVRTEEILVDGCVIDRTRFDKTLAIQALEAGADLCNGFVIRREARTMVARRNGVEAAFVGRSIVCSDGAASVVSA